MDAKMINPFLHATLEILAEVAFIDYRVGDFYVKKDNYGHGDVTAIVGLSGVGKGSVAVTFDEPIILSIVSNILDEAMTEINDLVIDAAGELTNMVTGRAVDKLAKNGFDLMLSVPTVVHGKQHRVVHHTESPVIVIPFQSSRGRFVVEFTFDERAQPIGSASGVDNSVEQSSKAPAGWGRPVGK